MKTKHIIIGLIILLVVLFFIQKKEHAGSTATPTSLSNEAIQNIPGAKRAEKLTKEIYDNVVKKRSEFLDHFEFLKNLVNHSDKDNKYFVDQCNLILEAYKEELARRTIKSALYKITIR